MSSYRVSTILDLSAGSTEVYSGNGAPGPFVSSQNAVYALCFEQDTTALTYKLRVFKATNPLGTWTEQDAGNSPTITAADQQSIRIWDTVQSGDTLHVVSFFNRPSGGDDMDYFYSQFSMHNGTSGDIFETVGGAKVENFYSPAGMGQTANCLFIGVRSNGDVVVHGPGPSDSNMGTSYARNAISRREGTTWTNGVDANDIDKNAATDAYILFGMMPAGGSDRFFLGWNRSDTGAADYSRFNGSNAFSPENVNFATLRGATQTGFPAATGTISGTNYVWTVLQEASPPGAMLQGSFTDPSGTPVYTGYGVTGTQVPVPGMIRFEPVRRLLYGRTFGFTTINVFQANVTDPPNKTLPTTNDFFNNGILDMRIISLPGRTVLGLTGVHSSIKQFRYAEVSLRSPSPDRSLMRKRAHVLR